MSGLENAITGFMIIGISTVMKYFYFDAIQKADKEIKKGGLGR